jgi:hypothetical protein
MLCVPTPAKEGLKTPLAASMIPLPLKFRFEICEATGKVAIVKGGVHCVMVEGLAGAERIAEPKTTLLLACGTKEKFPEVLSELNTAKM